MRFCKGGDWRDGTQKFIAQEKKWGVGYVHHGWQVKCLGMILD